MSKKKILFIIPWLPYPLSSGGHQALYNGIAAVSKDYDVHVAFEATDNEEYHSAARTFLKQVGDVTLHPLFHMVEVRSFKQKVFDKFVRILRKVLNVYPKPKTAEENTLDWWKTTVNPMSEAWNNHMAKICASQKFDIVQVEMPWIIPTVFALPDNVRTVHVHHELGFVRRELEKHNFSKDANVDALQRFTDFNEVGQLNLYDSLITLSPIDRQKLIDAGVVKPIFSSFAIVDSDQIITPYLSEERILTFIGPDVHNPNFVGITWFLENCWNNLKEKDNSYRLRIIGKWSEANIQAYTQKYKDVEFLGFVDDLYEAIKGTVMIVPITIGSGIRMKILEASNKGVPFVSTTVGAEGIPVIDGKDCFLTDDSNTFVEDILKLRDADLRKLFIINANKMVQENYSLEALRRNRLEIYSKLFDKQ